MLGHVIMISEDSTIVICAALQRCQKSNSSCKITSKRQTFTTSFNCVSFYFKLNDLND